jgi:hypothetical protein
MPDTATTYLVTLAATVVVLLVAWRPVRHLITAVHEGGHALVAILGGHPARVRIHADTSGLTQSRGRAVIYLAGYPAPALVGLGCAWLVAHGRPGAVPIVLLAVVVLLLPLIRNAYGVLTVVVLAAALVAATTLEPLPVAYVLTWSLLLGAVRAVGEGARLSDADAMARATHVPGVLWRGLFWLVVLGAAGLGGWWMWTVL